MSLGGRAQLARGEHRDVAKIASVGEVQRNSSAVDAQIEHRAKERGRATRVAFLNSLNGNNRAPINAINNIPRRAVPRAEPAEPLC